MEQRIVGIDFGTSTTLVADRTEHGEPTVLPIGQTTPWLPSVVGLDDAGNLVVGEEALALAPERTVRSIKSELTAGEQQVAVGGEMVDTKDIIAAILKEAIARADRVRPDLMKTSKIFVGCPALWTGAERRMLADACVTIGLDIDVADIIDEPVAAGLHWGHSRWLDSGRRPSGKTLVFDAGGGTLDVALMEIAGDESPSFTILAAEGRAESGDAVDGSIAALLRGGLSELPNGDRVEALLSIRSTVIKERLSSEESVSLALGGDYPTMLSLTRRELETAFDPQMSRALRLVTSSIRGSQLRVAQPLNPSDIRALAMDVLTSDIRHVALVGGLSQIPIVAEYLRSEFPRAEVELVPRPQESVAAGLTYGDRIVRLNLPRPPVNFVVEFTTESGRSLDPSLDSWAEEVRIAYNAYTPLYTSAEIMRGESGLGASYQIPFPDGYNGRLKVTLRCEAPDRARTRLSFRLPEGFGGGSGASVVAEGISVLHDRHRPARFKLKTNGDLTLSGSRGEFLSFKVQDWPSLRGAKHDWVREIRMHQSPDRPWISEMAVDNWRYQ
jgi:hypothetical protein